MSCIFVFYLACPFPGLFNINWPSIHYYTIQFILSKVQWAFSQVDCSRWGSNLNPLDQESTWPPLATRPLWSWSLCDIFPLNIVMDHLLQRLIKTQVFASLTLESESSQKKVYCQINLVFFCRKEEFCSGVLAQKNNIQKNNFMEKNCTRCKSSWRGRQHNVTLNTRGSDIALGHHCNLIIKKKYMFHNSLVTVRRQEEIKRSMVKWLSMLELRCFFPPFQNIH